MPELRSGSDLSTLKSVLSSAQDMNLLLSTEGLANHFDDFSPISTSELRRILQNYSIHICMVVRERRAWIKSYYKQALITVRNGAHPLWATAMLIDEFERHPRVQRLLDHTRLMNDISEALGGVSSTFNYESDLFRVVAHWLGVDFEEMAQVTRLHTSIPDWSAELVRRSNALNFPDEHRQALVGALRSEFPVWPKCIGHHLAASLLSPAVEGEFPAMHVEAVKFCNSAFSE